MAVMREYYEAVGAVTTRHEATLIGFDGDGVMLLVNAPVACEQPATQAVRLAIDLQMTVQSLAGKWYDSGHAIGFGAGLRWERQRSERLVITVGWTTRRSEPW